jgi:hypothetical protein
MLAWCHAAWNPADLARQPEAWIGLMYSEANTLLAIDASGISGALSPSFPKSKLASLYFHSGRKPARSGLVLSDAAVAVVRGLRHHNGE